MDDADPGRHNLEGVKRLHAPFKKLVTLAVALELDFEVAGKRVRGAVYVHLDRMVHDQIHRHQRLIILGFLPKRATAERIAARSTSSGTPVKSCNTMRATMKGISSVRTAFGCQLASARTLCSVTFLPSQLRRTDSSTSRMETGRRETGPAPARSSAGNE